MGQANTAFFFPKKSMIRSKISSKFKTVSLGSFEFKNVEKPIEVFALANEGLHVPARQTMEGKLKKKKSNWI